MTPNALHNINIAFVLHSHDSPQHSRLDGTVDTRRPVDTRLGGGVVERTWRWMSQSMSWTVIKQVSASVLRAAAPDRHGAREQHQTQGTALSTVVRCRSTARCRRVSHEAVAASAITKGLASTSCSGRQTASRQIVTHDCGSSPSWVW